MGEAVYYERGIPVEPIYSDARGLWRSDRGTRISRARLRAQEPASGYVALDF